MNGQVAFKEKILIVDDMPANIKILGEVLRNDYDIRFARSGQKALELALSDPPDLILLDIMMPNMDGYEVCKRLHEHPKTKNIQIIFITAMDSEEDEARGFDAGATDYITKPFQPPIVKARVKTHLELSRHRNYLEELVSERTNELRKTQKEIVYRLGRAAEFRDNETGHHVKRLSHYCAMFGEELGMDKEKQEQFMYASSMHDVGKIGIPDHILRKPGKLDSGEWEIMKKHTTIGSDMLDGSDSELLMLAQKIALTHHERWDGSGYPEGLKGVEIPIEGRITAICDVFDALTSERPYKKEWPVEKAVAEINLNRGKHFDPILVDMFQKIVPDMLSLRKKFPDE